MQVCEHRQLRCLNQFELIRKYRCEDCQLVMMCACEENVGREHLPHQLSQASELETGQRHPVTGGFVAAVCNACRGVTVEAHPLASIHGRTSKIKRYYWRELAFREMELFADWGTSKGISHGDAGSAEAVEAHQRCRRQALDEFKMLHREHPKYTFASESQSTTLRECEVPILNLDAVYIESGAKKAQLLFGNRQVTAEEYTRLYYEAQGYSVVDLESRPFHVLFGIYMWILIQDPADPAVRIVGFGDRAAYDAGVRGQELRTHLPEDFGSAGYGIRRAQAINEHLAPEMEERGQLEWLFDYWLSHSEDLRQYLWAHREEDVQTARALVAILPADRIIQILRYLVAHYWGHYLGWPDLLLHRGSEYLLVEVKSSGDKLSNDQSRWIRDNYTVLKFPFELVKLHKREVRDAVAPEP